MWRSTQCGGCGQRSERYDCLIDVVAGTGGE